MISLVERFPKLRGYGFHDRNSLGSIIVVVATVFMIVLVTVLSIVYNHNHQTAISTSGLTQASQLDTGNKDINTPTPSDSSLPGGGTSTGDSVSTGAGAPVITLTATPATVNIGQNSKLQWSVTNNPKTCTASDDWSGVKNATGEESTGALGTIKTYNYTLTCINDAGSGSSAVSVGVMGKTSVGGPNAPEVTLAATPTTAYLGGSTNLSWTTINSPTKCETGDDWGNNVPKAVKGSESFGPLSAIQTEIFTLTCYNSAGSGSATVAVKVIEPPAQQPVITFNSSPVSTAHLGESVTLSWSVTNAPLGCTASNDWSGTKPASSTGLPPQVVGPLTQVRDYTFTLTCDNNGKSASKSVIITALPFIPTVSLTATPTSGLSPLTSRLDWSFQNTPTSCTATGWSPASVNVSVNPGTTTLTNLTANAASDKQYTYTLTCSNAGGTSAPASITVTAKLPPPTLTFTADAISLTTAQSTTLRWTSTGATSCTTGTSGGTWGNNIAKTLTGSQGTGAFATAGTYTYNLQCSNAGGTINKSVSITVTQAGNPVVAPVVTLSIDKTSMLTTDQTGATLSWTVTNAPTSCTPSGGTAGWQALSASSSGTYGTGQISTANTYNFTLTCSNSAGSNAATKSVTVTAPPPAPVVTLSLSATSITLGSSTTANWTATNLPITGCTAATSGTNTTLFTGSKSVAANGTGSQSLTPAATGVYNLSFNCSNATGLSNTATATLTVTGAAVYCSGATPCYGPLDLIDSTQTYGSGTTGFDTRVGTGGTKVNGTVVGKAGRGSGLQCWGFIGTQIIDLKAFGPAHDGTHYYVYNTSNSTAGPVTTTSSNGSTKIGKGGTTTSVYAATSGTGAKVTGGGCGQDVDGILKGNIKPTNYGTALNHSGAGGVAPNEALLKTYYLVSGTYDYTKP